MKKKLNLLGLLFFLLFLNLNAQMLYYYRGKKIPLTVDRNYVHIIAVDEFIRSSSTDELFQNLNLELDDRKPVQGLVKLRLKSEPDILEYSKLVELLKQNEQIKHVFPFFERGDAAPIGISDIFYVKLKEVGDTILLRMIAQEQNVQIVEQIPYMPLWYILSIRNSTLSNSIDATNYFYETGHFEAVDPAFMFHFKTNCIDDPMFGLLWGLKNEVNQGIDIKACDAWAITRGAGIKVAVVDKPIDTNHGDLAANILSVFNTQNRLDPLEPDDDSPWHGTYVAGIVAAVRNNNFQVVGVSPESKIMGVSHNLNASSTCSAELASGITWAWQNGADVINNSWGDEGGLWYSYLQSTTLEDAIIAAMTQGRNGKGSVVVFGSGNNGLWDRVNYPGNFHSDILTVGAIVPDGSLWEKSNQGNDLDVVAPGFDIYSTQCDNKVGGANGTSAAAPHVSGIAALVLSVNPNLTGQQVRDIIESTAQKVKEVEYGYDIVSGRPNGTWNDATGYGLVDAHAAVLAALETRCYNRLRKSIYRNVKQSAVNVARRSS